MSDDFSGCKPPMRHIAGINVDMLRRGGAAPQPAPQGASSKLLHRAMEQLYAWSKKYGEHQPAWLPPAGDVTLCEDIAEYIAQRSVPVPQGVAPEGYMLVPIDPTDAMQRAGGHANSEWLNDNAPIGEGRYAMPIKSIWSAMLAAAISLQKEAP